MGSLLTIILFAVFTSCTHKMKVTGAEPVEVCDVEYLVQHTSNRLSCSEVELYEDPEFPVIYSVCAGSDENSPFSMIMPTSFYEYAAESPGMTGTTISCQDDFLTVVDK